MAAGTYKNGVAIIVTYQAVNAATGKTVTMAVYDEAHALDAGKGSAGLTEIGTTGRYYATFTPDAEGEWIVILKNTTDANGEVVKAYAVSAHDVDSVGDAVDAIQTDLSNETDGLGALKTLVDAVNTDLGNETDGLGALKALVDTVNTDLSNETDGLSALKALIDTANSGIAGIGSPAMVG